MNVLVTGGSGFIASHCILQLLEQGHAVRTTVRSAKREADVRALLAAGGATKADQVTFVVADLEADAGWAEACAGIDHVLHVASPFPATLPKHDDELVIPAREGALRVLRAARDAKVQRVVLTSSFAAIGYGHRTISDKPYDETSWTDPEAGDIAAYVKSKAIAERAAWDFLEREGGSLELATVCPVGVFGPVLGKDYSTSILLVQRMLDGKMPGVPKMWFGVVDVRDVADLHLRAMVDPAAKGQRFLAVADDFMSIKEIAQALKDGLGDKAKRVKTMQLPKAAIWLASRFDPAVKQILPELGKQRNGTSAKAQRLLGWKPRSNREAIVATGESLVRLGLVRS